MTGMTSLKKRAARISVWSNFCLMLLKLLVGISLGSVSIISEAIHSGADLLAAFIAFFSVKKAGEPADEEHEFGHGKVENLAGTIEAILIFTAGFWIIYESIQKFQGQSAIGMLEWGVLVMGFSAVTNLFVSRYLFRVAKETDSVALEGDALHLKTDVYTSAGVMVGLTLIYFTNIYWLDPLIAILVAVFILKAAWELMKNAFLPLLDVKLPINEEKAIEDIIKNHADNFIDFHKMRTRKAGSERHIDLHLVVPFRDRVDKAHDLCHRIAEDIEKHFPQSHVLIHIEPCGSDNCEHCNKCEEKKVK